MNVFSKVAMVVILMGLAGGCNSTRPISSSENQQPKKSSVSQNGSDLGKTNQTEKVTKILGLDINSPVVQSFMKALGMELEKEISSQRFKAGQLYGTAQLERIYTTPDRRIVLRCYVYPYAKPTEKVFAIAFLLPVSTDNISKSTLTLPSDLSGNATPEKALARWGRPDMNGISPKGTGFLYFDHRGESCITYTLWYEFGRLSKIEFS